MKPNSETKIIVLGGLGEVGKNMYCLMHENEIIDFDAFVPKIDYSSFLFQKTGLFVLQSRELTTRLFGPEDKISKFR